MFKIMFMKKYLINVIALFLVYNISNAQTTIPRAQSLFIYNFTRLIEWPQSYKTGDFVVGVLGNGQIYDELSKTLSGKKVSTQNVNLVSYKDPNDIEKCHILVVPFSQSSHIAAAISKLGNQGTLVITEKSGMLDNGAIINFIIDGNALKFELNKEAAIRRGLNINSTLEKMAVVN